jgi:DNA helicase-2/ATP-dependent DNA helicase PcrA
MITRTEQIEQFQKIYNSLNEQQRQAVDTIEGPVMVIAGPGTGKTQILGARIGKILLETDTNPDNILCLTYTDAGVIAMRKRLLGFIGPDAYKVRIYTFHAFCNDIIQENLSLFEKTALDPISDLERIALLKELIDGFPKNHPLKRYRGDVYYEVRNLQQLFSTMKREGWTPEYILSCIDRYIAELPTRDEFVYKRAYKQFKAGDLKQHKIDEETERMAKLRAAVQEFPRFQELMSRERRYDFDDMINWVIRAFETDKNILARYQEQFQYILVDEYQDTSGTQNRLVELLISFWEEPNVFVVGDDDQSIYRFQGANVENMQIFADRYQDSLLKVVLTNNYRSTQPILNVSKTLIERNTERLVNKNDGLSKELVAANSRLNSMTHLPHIHEYASPREEMIHVTRQIKSLIESDIAPGQIAVIYRENKYGEELAKYFQQKQIPVYSKRTLNILHQPLAQNLILLLKYLAAEHDVPYGGDEMLFELLHFNWFSIAPIDIARMSAEVADRRFGEQKISFRQLVYDKINKPPADLFSREIPGLRQAGDALEKLIGDVPNLTLVQLFENIIREAGVLRAIMESPEKHFHFEVLTGLFNFIKEETRRNPLLSLDELVNLFTLMQDEGISLPLTRVTGTDSGVNLLTAHGSKGLEYEYVFVVGCNAGNWEKKKKRGDGYHLPDTIFSNQAPHNDDEELRRLFYVALTRAAQHLYISYSRTKTDGKEAEPSMFIAEIQQEHHLPVEQVIVDAELLSEFAALEFETGLSPEIAAVEADFITRALEKFVMNVTALNNYLKCPLQFYFNNLVRVPSGKSEATEFGSAVHYALQMLFQKMQQQENHFPSKEVFMEDFKWYMYRHRENFTREQFNRRMEQGEEVLGNYYDRYINEWNPIVKVEMNVRNVVVKNVPLKGKLDKLEFDGHQVNVVDYKTGDIEKARKKLKGPSDKDPNGGDYWRQAVFYKLLIDNFGTRNWKVVSTEFDFVEPDKKKQYHKEKLLITEADITTVTQQIVDVWEKIQQRQFTRGCGKDDCHWCSFVKNHQLAVALHQTRDEDAEEED